MKTAAVTLIREGEASAMMHRTFIEEVRGFLSIKWTASHVVFNMKDGTIIAYKADRVHELVTYNEEE